MPPQTEINFTGFATSDRVKLPETDTFAHANVPQSRHRRVHYVLGPVLVPLGVHRGLASAIIRPLVRCKDDAHCHNLNPSCFSFSVCFGLRVLPLVFHLCAFVISQQRSMINAWVWTRAAGRNGALLLFGATWSVHMLSVRVSVLALITFRGVSTRS